MVYYVLQAHARDVNFSENIGDIGRHTGYDLIAYEGNTIKSVQSLDLGIDAKGNIEILYRDGDAVSVVYDGKTQIWNEQTQIDGGFIDVDQEMATSKRFETTTVATGQDALTAFNNMRLNMKFVNALKNIDKEIDYNGLMGPNCNTWTNTMARNYLGGQNIFSGFSVGSYVGSNKTMTGCTSGADNTQCVLIDTYINKFNQIAREKNVNYSNSTVNLQKANTDWVCFINNCTVDGKICNFVFDSDANNIVTVPVNSNDTYIYAADGENVVNSGKGNDYIEGGKDRDTIYGGAGNDEIYGKEGNNDLYGGAGNDKIYGGSGIDKVWTGSGKDKVYVGAGNDEVNTKDGGAKNDENAIFLGKGSDIFTGGSGEDNVDGGSGFTSDQTVISAADMTDEEGDTNTVHLGAGDDYYTGGKGTDKVWGEADSDIIHGGEGNDFLYGGVGVDFLHGGDGVDIIDGGQGDGKISNFVDILIAA